MKVSRRMKRMNGTKKKVGGLSLVSLMDVFTILVFFLLTNTATDEVLKDPKEIELPEAVVEAKPRETIVIFVSQNDILMQGELVMKTAEALAEKKDILSPITAKLQEQRKNVIGVSTKAVADSKEVTVLADRKVPFFLLKKIMSSSTAAGYGKISLAVIQKASQN